MHAELGRGLLRASFVKGGLSVEEFTDFPGRG
jgi:hypothetical protein